MKKVFGTALLGMAIGGWLGHRYMKDPLRISLGAVVGGTISMTVFLPRDTVAHPEHQPKRIESELAPPQ